MYVKPMGLCYSLFLLRMFFNLASPAECIFPELFFFLGYTYATAPKKLDIKTFGVLSSAENFRGACVSRLCIFMTLIYGGLMVRARRTFLPKIRNTIFISLPFLRVLLFVYNTLMFSCLILFFS